MQRDATSWNRAKISASLAKAFTTRVPVIDALTEVHFGRLLDPLGRVQRLKTGLAISLESLSHCSCMDTNDAGEWEEAHVVEG